MTKCLKKLELNSRSGAGASKEARCKKFESLLFMKDTVANRATESNISERLPSPSTIASSSASLQSTQAQASDDTVQKRKNIDTRDTRKSKKINDRKESIDYLLIEALNKTKDEVPAEEKEDDKDLLFVKSIVPILKILPPKKNRLAKIEIQQLLLRYEFDE